MAGTVYLKTDRFEVKLEAITFKTKDFESLCRLDFLFPDEKVWACPPIVGLDVMCHPRDPSIILLLLCFGTGCVILRFGAGEELPPAIHRFLADKRIQVVSFGIPEKLDIFPFEELGLRKSKVDIGYLAARTLKDSKYKRRELAELAQKVLGIKRMIGMTEASSFERHERIKCAICQLFVTTVIAMGLLAASDKKKLDDSTKKSSFLKNLNSLHLLAEGWFKLPKGKKKKQEAHDDIHIHKGKMGDTTGDNYFDNVKYDEARIVDFLASAEIYEGDYEDHSYLPKTQKKYASSKDLVRSKVDDNGDSSDDSGREGPCTTKKPIKGILKCPSTTLHRWNSVPSQQETATSPSTPRDQTDSRDTLKRANSKGHNVSFKFQ